MAKEGEDIASTIGSSQNLAGKSEKPKGMSDDDWEEMDRTMSRR